MDAGDPTGAFEAARREATGYAWTTVARTLLRLRAPELAARLGYDPEGSMFCAHGTDRAALEPLRDHLLGVIEDSAALRAILAQVDPASRDD